MDTNKRSLDSSIASAETDSAISSPAPEVIDIVRMFRTQKPANVVLTKFQLHRLLRTGHWKSQWRETDARYYVSVDGEVAPGTPDAEAMEALVKNLSSLDFFTSIELLQKPCSRFQVLATI